MLNKADLSKKYLVQKLSVSQISKEYKCSENKITYWLQKYRIPKRSISEGVYVRSNPKGDPFRFRKPKVHTEWFLYGLGLGLFWGEGNKVNKNSVRLGNTDVDLIRKFLEFLYTLYEVEKTKIRFGLQLFSDISKEEALTYWTSELDVPLSQFQKVVTTKSIRRGTYRKKSQYGVLTIYFSNTKLRDTIMSAITELRKKPL